jgi:hypothetical protein
MVRDFPGLMQALREMSRFKYLEARMYLDSGQLTLALENCLNVFTRDIENFPTADRIVRNYTGQNIREMLNRRFWIDRYKTSFETDRMDIYGTATQALGEISAEEGEETADSMMYEVMTRVGENFQIEPEQAMDLYYYVQSLQNGNLPGYMRIWRHQVLQGHKPIRAPFTE